MENSDKYYIQRCLDGHPDDFRYLVRNHQWPLAAYLGGKLGNKSEVEEVAQETFVRAYFSLGQLRKPQLFGSWLIGIAERVAKEKLREQNRFKAMHESFAADEADCSESHRGYELEQAIARLPGQYRDMILLRFYAGRSCKEIAATLDMKLGTVTKTLSRAYSQLRRLLKRTAQAQ
jgi:RNA polymerase sigma-70 factor (ECF subfamily)